MMIHVTTTDSETAIPPKTGMVKTVLTFILSVKASVNSLNPFTPFSNP